MMVALALGCSLQMSAQDDIKGKSRENINTWLNSPQLQEWASKPELQALISLFAKQIFVVNGRLFGTDDFEPNPYPIQGAQVLVTCVGDTAEVYTAASNEDGEFLVPIFLRSKLKSNDLHIKISYIGMDGVDSVYTPREVKLLGQKVLQVELDSLVLRSNSVTLAEAEVIGELQKLYQRGDTVIFNTEAYEMPSGSVLLDLVRRLPGLQYIGGKLTYMNRDIEEIRLNGEDFFKRDMSIALQNMRHDKLKSLKVYEVPDDTLDVMSEQHLVMDMHTKDAMNVVYMGNAAVGATLPKFDHWEVSADLSRWQKNGGQAHAEFRTSDVPSATTEDERHTSARGTYEHQLGNTKLEGGINYGYNRTEQRTTSVNQVYMPDYTQNSHSERRSGNKNRQYGGNVRLDGHWGKNTFWNTRVDLSKSMSEGWSISTDSISNNLSPVSATKTQTRSNSNSKNINWSGGLQQYLGDERETELGLNANFGHSDGESTNTNINTTRFYLMGDSLRIVNQVIEAPNRSNRAGAQARFRHRFGEYTNLGVNYDFSYSHSTDSQTYSDVVNDALQAIDSLHYDNKYRDVAHGPSMDLKYDNKTLLLQLNGRAHPTTRTADNTRYLQHDHNSYTAVQYRANARMELKMHQQKNKLTLSYNGSNQLPSANDISTTVDYSNPMNIRMGNPNLKQAFRHQMQAEYQVGALLRVSSSYNRTDRQQTTLSIIDRNTGVRTSMPTNINGNWGANSYLFLTKQVKEVSLSALANYSYSHNVTYVQDYSTAVATPSASNWQRLDAQLMAMYGNKWLMAMARATYSMDHNQSDYVATATQGKLAGATLGLEYTLPLKVNIKLKSDFNYNKRFGYDLASANRSEYIWNASIEYKFLSIVTASLEWRDILKSQRGFNASMSATGWSETQQYGQTNLVLFRLAVKLFK